MNVKKNAPGSKRAQRRMLAATGVAACALSAGLVTAAPANAESRGFVLTNNSSATLRMEGLNPVHCGDVYILCQRGYYPVDFEGRPYAGDEIAPGGSHRIDLKYGFNLSTAPQYAAQLTYKIEHTNAKLELWIETTPTQNNSRCAVVPASAGKCTAGGLGITFTR